MLGCPDAVRAFRALILAHPDAVQEATKTWFGNSAPDQILPVFFAIASSDEGAAFLLDGVKDEAARGQFVRAWQQLLLKEDSRETVDRQLTRWGRLADEGRLPHGKLVDLLADVYEPDVLRSGLNRFYDDSPGFLESFWDMCSERRSSAAGAAVTVRRGMHAETAPLVAAAGSRRVHLALPGAGHPVFGEGHGRLPAFAGAACQGAGGRARGGPARAR
ncbi:hypothetical protein HX747_22680 [Streptomyces sp. L06]|nr:hypothetical protein [Streptomyces sp. L06]